MSDPSSSGTEVPPILQCCGVTKRFEDRSPITVLDGVDLSVNGGEVVLITGRTGAGKTTLLGILAGLDRLSSGRVVLDGRPLEDLGGEDRARLRRQKVGFVFQNFNLIPAWTAVENVEAALMHGGLRAAERRARARALLEDLGLGDRLDHLPSMLSVGQQQCVAIARAVANRPRLVLADEPTGDVDRETACQVVARLLALVRRDGGALVVASHGPFPPEAATRVLCLTAGKLGPA